MSKSQPDISVVNSEAHNISPRNYESNETSLKHFTFKNKIQKQTTSRPSRPKNYHKLSQKRLRDSQNREEIKKSIKKRMEDLSSIMKSNKSAAIPSIIGKS